MSERSLVIVLLVPVRSLAISCTFAGGSGRVLSSVNDTVNTADVWPRLSVAWSERVCGPSASGVPPLIVGQVGRREREADAGQERGHVHQRAAVERRLEARHAARVIDDPGDRRVGGDAVGARDARVVGQRRP